MRILLAMTLLASLSISSGCMVMDELDAAASLMPSNSKTKQSTKESEAVPLTPGAERQNALLEQSKQWWDRASSLAPAELEASIVSCRLRGTTQFMSKDDCLSRGGTPRGV